MAVVFADTSYYIALLVSSDEHHAAAARLGARFDREEARLLTSHAVIFEVLAFISRGGPRSRERAVELVDRIGVSPAMEIVGLDDELFGAALDLYRSRLDKRYSLADCLAMVICRDRGISEVLTTDRDFEAEGFTILLGH